MFVEISVTKRDFWDEDARKGHRYILPIIHWAQVVIAVVIKPRKVIKRRTIHSSVVVYYSRDGREAITPRMGTKKPLDYFRLVEHSTKQQRLFCARATVMIWQSNLFDIIGILSFCYFVPVLYAGERKNMMHPQVYNIGLYFVYYNR